MNSEEPITALQIAMGLQDIYDSFTDSIHSMGKNTGGKISKSPFAQSALHWIAGSRIRTERDVLSDKFVEDVQKQIELLELALEGISEEESQEACAAAARILSAPVPEKSNGTISLMKRAMLGQVKPLLPRLSREQLTQLKERIEGAYKKNQRLPVEQEVLKEIGKLLK